MTVKLQGGIGGNGAGNSGGSGDDFYLYKEAGGGDVKVLKTGAANAAFTAKSFTPSFGAVKATVSANTTLSRTGRLCGYPTCSRRAVSGHQ